LSRAIDPIREVGARAGKADHAPGSHVAIAAVKRISEIAFLRVLEKLVEEGSGQRCRNAALIRLKQGQECLLTGDVQFSESFVPLLLARAVNGHDPQPVEFARRMAQLVAEFGRSVRLERPLM
jgi:hypothetical protein